jgi:hypothetical protein
MVTVFKSVRSSLSGSVATWAFKQAPPTWPGSPEGNGASNRRTGCVRDTAYREDSDSGYTGNGPQVMATCRNIAIGLLQLAGVTAITRTLQAIGRDRTRMLSYLPL